MAPPTRSLTPEQINQIVGLAWHDRTSFDALEKKCGLREPEVIELMRRALKPSSFRRWRERVSGRVTKHRKKLKRHLNPPEENEFDLG